MQKPTGEVGCLSPTRMNEDFKDEARKLLLRKCLESLTHACQCRDANCHLSSCRKLKRVLQHSTSCKRQTVDGCQICKQFFTLCICHAKTCKAEKCPVAFCHKIKQKLEKQRLQKMEEEKVAAALGGGGGGGGGGGSSEAGATSSASDGGQSFQDAISGQASGNSLKSQQTESSSSNSLSESMVKEQFLNSTDF